MGASTFLATAKTAAPADMAGAMLTAGFLAKAPEKSRSMDLFGATPHLGTNASDTTTSITPSTTTTSESSSSLPWWSWLLLLLLVGLVFVIVMATRSFLSARGKKKRTYPFVAHEEQADSPSSNSESVAASSPVPFSASLNLQ